MKVLLVNPIMRAWAKPNWAPLGLGYVATALERAGHSVRILDLNALREEAPPLAESLAWQPEWIGITGLIPTYGTICELTRNIRAHTNAPIVIGGPIGSYIPRMLLETGACDFVVVGEGEVTAVEFCAALPGKRFAGVLGLWRKDAAGQAVANPPRPVMDCQEMASFWPARHLIPMDRYLHNPLGANNSRKWTDGGTSRPVCNTNLIASRGCPYACVYCAKDFAGTRHRRYDYRSVVHEIDMLHRQYGVDYVNFADDEWMADPAWCSKHLGYWITYFGADKVRWGCTGRANLITADACYQMKNAGCVHIGLGLESGSPAMLESMNKRATVEDAELAVGYIQRIMGPQAVSCTFMVGLPGETLETMEDTARLCRRAGIRPDNIFFATPYPGTPLYARMREAGKIGDELAYVKSLGEQGDRIACNCCDIPDAELRAKRDEMLAELRP